MAADMLLDALQEAEDLAGPGHVDWRHPEPDTSVGHLREDRRAHGHATRPYPTRIASIENLGQQNET
eukprot:5329052-Heterocapsa_arctica.AAC.1